MQKSTYVAAIARNYDLVGYTLLGLALLGFLYLFNFTTFFGPLSR